MGGCEAGGGPVLIALVFVLVGAAMLAFGLARWRIRGTP